MIKNYLEKYSVLLLTKLWRNICWSEAGWKGSSGLFLEQDWWSIIPINVFL